VLNVPLLRGGRLPDPARPEEVLVSEAFARAHGLHPGDSFAATLHGQRRNLRMVGTALSPEFIYMMAPGSMLPDDRLFTLIWMGEAAMAAAADLEGAFNDLALSLRAGASEARVIAGLDRVLAPYGGTGAYGRDRQQSHAFLENELSQLRAMAQWLPPGGSGFCSAGRRARSSGSG
jgi:putative ABC transport system permease protein